MATRRRAFHHETIDRAFAPFEQGLGQGDRRDDGQKLRPFELPEQPGDAGENPLGVKMHPHLVLRPGAVRIQPIGDGLMASQLVQYARHLGRDAGAHQHIVHPRQHRAIQRGEIGHLHFFEQVDPDHTRVILPGEKDLDIVGQRGQLIQEHGRVDRVGGGRLVRRVGRFAALDVVALEDGLHHFRQGQAGEGAPHVPAEVAIGEPAGQHPVDPGARNNAQLSKLRHSPGQGPVGDRHTHAALNNKGEIHGPSLTCFVTPE